MKKLRSLFCLSALLISLTACGNEEMPNASEPPSQSTTAPLTADTQDGNEGDSENASQNSIISQFETPWGGTPDLSEARVTGKNDTELPLSELTEDNWNYVVVDWVYLAEPNGISYNSIDSADIFDEAKKSFKDAPQSVNHQYKKYRVGDTVCSLTLTYASTTFRPENCAISPKYFNGGIAMFDGELTLTGKMRIVSGENDGEYSYPGYKGDIRFIPDAESCKLPVINYLLQDTEGNEKLTYGSAADMVWCSEYRYPIDLGNVSDYEISFDGIPDNGDFVDAKIVVSNINLRNDYMLAPLFGGKIEELTIEN